MEVVDRRSVGDHEPVRPRAQLDHPLRAVHELDREAGTDGGPEVGHRGLGLLNGRGRDCGGGNRKAKELHAHRAIVHTASHESQGGRIPESEAEAAMLTTAINAIATPHV